MSLLRFERKRREGIFFAFYSIISRASEDDRLTAVGKGEKSVIHNDPRKDSISLSSFSLRLS